MPILWELTTWNCLLIRLQVTKVTTYFVHIEIKKWVYVIFSLLYARENICNFVTEGVKSSIKLVNISVCAVTKCSKKL